MEDVLDLYAEPDDEARPVVNFDEKSKQLVAGTRAVMPAARSETPVSTGALGPSFDGQAEPELSWRSSVESQPAPLTAASR